MSLREFFAGLAMQALLSTEISAEVLAKAGDLAIPAFCNEAVLISDALIAELEKQESEDEI